MWGVVPQSSARLSPERNSRRELVGLDGRDRSQVRGDTQPGKTSRDQSDRDGTRV